MSAANGQRLLTRSIKEPKAPRDWRVGKSLIVGLRDLHAPRPVRRIRHATSQCSQHSLSIGFAGWPDVQLICHAHEFSEGFGFHLDHHPGPVNFDRLFSGAELAGHLFVE